MLLYFLGSLQAGINILVTKEHHALWDGVQTISWVYIRVLVQYSYPTLYMACYVKRCTPAGDLALIVINLKHTIMGHMRSVFNLSKLFGSSLAYVYSLYNTLVNLLMRETIFITPWLCKTYGQSVKAWTVQIWNRQINESAWPCSFSVYVVCNAAMLCYVGRQMNIIDSRQWSIKLSCWSHGTTIPGCSRFKVKKYVQSMSESVSSMFNLPVLWLQDYR